MPTNPLLQLSYDKNNNAPIYQQLHDQIVAQIQTHELPAGTRLPTSRALAASLGLNRNTIMQVYRLLQQQGWVVSLVGRGTTVRQQTEMLAHEQKSVPWAHLLSGAALRLPNFVPPKNVDPQDIWLSRMQPSADLVPFVDLQKCLQIVLKKYGAQAFLYAPTSGVAPLHEMIAKELRHLNVDPDKNEIIVTNGSSQALDLVVRALVNPGDRVLIEEPSYHSTIQLFKMMDANLVPLPSDVDGPLFANLPDNALRGVKVCFLIPNFRNPTGTSIDLKRRGEIATWLNNQGVLLIEDDYGSELAYGPAAEQPIKSLANDNVIYLGSFSKRIVPGLRLGYVVVPKGILAEKLHTLKWLVDLGNPALLQYTVTEFVELGYYEKHLKKVLQEYRQRMQVTDKAMRQHLPKEISWDMPQGGPFFWLRLPERLPVQELIQRCRQRRLHISGGKTWSASGADLPGLRLIFSSEPAERLQAGVKILAEVMHEMLQHPATTQMVQENMI